MQIKKDLYHLRAMRCCTVLVLLLVVRVSLRSHLVARLFVDLLLSLLLFGYGRSRGNSLFSEIYRNKKKWYNIQHENKDSAIKKNMTIMATMYVCLAVAKRATAMECFYFLPFRWLGCFRSINEYESCEHNVCTWITVPQSTSYNISDVHHWLCLGFLVFSIKLIHFCLKFDNS